MSQQRKSGDSNLPNFMKIDPIRLQQQFQEDEQAENYRRMTEQEIQRKDFNRFCIRLSIVLILISAVVFFIMISCINYMVNISFGNNIPNCRRQLLDLNNYLKPICLQCHHGHILLDQQTCLLF